MTYLNQLPLRTTLWIDAIATGATALLALLGAGPLEGLLDLPATLLRMVGGSLIPFVMYLVVLATRDVVSRTGAWFVVALNLAWVAGSILLLASGQVDPNPLGYAFVIGQAAAVALFAELQASALGRDGHTHGVPA